MSCWASMYIWHAWAAPLYAQIGDFIQCMCIYIRMYICIALSYMHVHEYVSHAYIYSVAATCSHCMTQIIITHSMALQHSTQLLVNWITSCRVNSVNHDQIKHKLCSYVHTEMQD